MFLKTKMLNKIVYMLHMHDLSHNYATLVTTNRE